MLSRKTNVPQEYKGLKIIIKSQDVNFTHIYHIFCSLCMNYHSSGETYIFGDSLISLNIIVFSYIHFVAEDMISLCYGCIAFHTACVCVFAHVHVYVKCHRKEPLRKPKAVLSFFLSSNFIFVLRRLCSDKLVELDSQDLVPVMPQDSQWLRVSCLTSLSFSFFMWKIIGMIRIQLFLCVFLGVIPGHPSTSDEYQNEYVLKSLF